MATAAVLAVFVARPAEAAPQALTSADVSGIIARVVNAAQNRGAPATVAVVDREGTVLAIWQMPGAPDPITITPNPQSSINPPFPDSLNLINVIPAADVAVAKAVTGAYLSSSLGNAFTTRTASQIIEDHFDPGTQGAASGPLYGVQFSSLNCSDLVNSSYSQMTGLNLGPHRSPLGLAGDPGGLPIYKGGQLVGGVGVKAKASLPLEYYGLDISNFHGDDNSVDESLAVQGASGFPAPDGILASRITVGGLLLKYTDVPSNFVTATPAPPLSALPGGLISLAGYYDATGGILNGNAYGTPASGLVLDTSGLFSATSPPMILSNGNCVGNACGLRYPPSAGAGPGALTQFETLTILRNAYAIALKTRAQLRLGAAAAINISVVDANGTLLGLISVPDAPLFGIDVSLQKARSALFLSSPSAQDALTNAPYYVNQYVNPSLTFFNRPIFNGSVAWSARAIGTVARDTFPDGIANTPNGPLGRPANVSNPFDDGLQEDLVSPYIALGLFGYNFDYCAGFLGAPPGSPTGKPILSNGLQIFPGGFPIYRNGVLIGGIGVSGDGVDQDDLISFLGLYNAGQQLGTGIGHAPMSMRANLLTAFGNSPHYVNCPYAPFLNSNSNDVCSNK
jgi:uncharacterized protein GlcG (DUF336 family)